MSTMNNKHSTPRSLLMRGIDYLSRREYSRLELYRKLVRTLGEGETVDDVQNVLDRLESEGYLSNERYAQSRVRVRSVRYGDRRLVMELKERGVDSDSIAQAISEAAPEYERALSVYIKKFQQSPRDAKERNKQIRFMASRGFSFTVINKIISGSEEFDNESELN